MRGPVPVGRYLPHLDGFGGIDLAEVNRRAALLDRMENKYLIRASGFESVLGDLRPHFDVLVIGERAVFTYETVYFDSPDLVSYHHHIQGRRQRFKVRTRRYVESNLCFFEVKLKGVRGRTVKKRFACSDADFGQMNAAADTFLRNVYQRSYGRPLELWVAPRLAMRYRRLTLVGRDVPERMTVDFGLMFIGPDRQWVAAPNDVLIVEAKSQRGAGTADEVLRRHGVRATSCSKYCVGLNMTEPRLRYNPFKRTLQEYFDWSPRSGAAPFTLPTPGMAVPDLFQASGRVVSFANYVGSYAKSTGVSAGAESLQANTARATRSVPNAVSMARYNSPVAAITAE